MPGPPPSSELFPERVAKLDLAARTWWRVGLDRPWSLPDDDVVALVPSLGEAPVVASLDRPCALTPGEEMSFTVAWPVVWSLQVGGVILDTFRPGMREAVLGPIGEGRILPAAPCARLQGPPPPTHAALTLLMRPVAQGPSVVRRVAFDERGLTLARVGDHLVAGDVIVRVQLADHASTVSRRPSLPEGAVVLREGARDAQDGHPSGLRWWLDGTRRSMGFSL